MANRQTKNSDSSGVEMKATIAVDSLSLDEHLGTGARLLFPTKTSFRFVSFLVSKDTHNNNNFCREQELSEMSTRVDCEA
jgi:hypothetical protein